MHETCKSSNLNNINILTRFSNLDNTSADTWEFAKLKEKGKNYENKVVVIGIHTLGGIKPICHNGWFVRGLL